jgi:hypothetical protein
VDDVRVAALAVEVDRDRVPGGGDGERRGRLEVADGGDLRPGRRGHGGDPRDRRAEQPRRGVHLVDPAVDLEAARDGRVEELRRRRLGVPLGAAHDPRLADRARRDQPLGLAVGPAVPAVEADVQHQPARPGELGQPGVVCVVQSQRLLAQHVAACGQGRLDELGVTVRRGRDHDRLDVVALQRVSQLRVGGDAGGRHRGGSTGHDVADRAETHAAGVGGSREVRLALAAGAHERDPERRLAHGRPASARRSPASDRSTPSAPS